MLAHERVGGDPLVDEYADWEGLPVVSQKWRDLTESEVPEAGRGQLVIEQRQQPKFRGLDLLPGNRPDLNFTQRAGQVEASAQEIADTVQQGVPEKDPRENRHGTAKGLRLRTRAHYRMGARIARSPSAQAPKSGHVDQ
jgi:hypothetical protein